VSHHDHGRPAKKTAQHRPYIWGMFFFASRAKVFWKQSA
jgi:hypothetical protein